MTRPIAAPRLSFATAVALVVAFMAATGSSQSAPAAPSAPATPPGDAAVPTAPAVPAAPAQPADAGPVAGTAEPPAAGAAAPPAAPEPPPLPTPALTTSAAPSPGAAVPAPSAASTPAAPAAPDMPEGEAERMAERPFGTARYTPGQGFQLATEDGDFALRTKLWGQFLYTFSSGAAGAEDRHSFQIRRARLVLSGNMWGKDTRYQVMIALSPRDVGREPVGVVGLPDPAVTAAGTPAVLTTSKDVVQYPPLLEWYLDFAQLRDLNVRVGQAKVPFSRQRAMPDSNHQFVDGRNTGAEFSLDRDIGIDFRSPDFLGAGLFRYYAGLYAGEGLHASDKTLGAGEPGFMYVARVELLPLGIFSDYEEADFDRSDAARLSIGAAYALVQGDAVSPQATAFGAPVIAGADPTPLVDFNSNNLTADVVFKLSGFSAQTALHYRKVNGTFGGVDPRNGLGWMLQGGYLLPRTIVELAAAYALIRGTGDTTLADQNEVGLGVNCYFARHLFKLQLDAFHVWAPDAWKQGENRLRLQLQASL